MNNALYHPQIQHKRDTRSSSYNILTIQRDMTIAFTLLLTCMPHAFSPNGSWTAPVLALSVELPLEFAPNMQLGTLMCVLIVPGLVLSFSTGSTLGILTVSDANRQLQVR